VCVCVCMCVCFSAGRPATLRKSPSYAMYYIVHARLHKLFRVNPVEASHTRACTVTTDDDIDQRIIL